MCGDGPGPRRLETAALHHPHCEPGAGGQGAAPDPPADPPSGPRVGATSLGRLHTPGAGPGLSHMPPEDLQAKVPSGAEKPPASRGAGLAGQAGYRFLRKPREHTSQHETHLSRSLENQSHRSLFPLRPRCPSLLQDSPRGPVRAGWRPPPFPQGQSLVIKEPTVTSPSRNRGLALTCACRRDVRGQPGPEGTCGDGRDAHTASSFSFRCHVITGGFVEKPEQGRRHPGHRGHQPRGQTGRRSGPPEVDSRRSEGGRGRGDPAPTRAQRSLSRSVSIPHLPLLWGPVLSKDFLLVLDPPGLSRKS